MMGLEPTTFCMASRRSSQLSYIRVAGASLAEARGDGPGDGLQAGERPDHHRETLDEAVLAVLEDVDPLQVAVADVRLEEQERRAPVRPLVRVAEVLEHLRDDAEQREHGVAAVVRLVDGRAAELDVLGEQLRERRDVAGLDRLANGHAASSASFFTLYSPRICLTISSESETTSRSDTCSSTALRSPPMRPLYSATLFVA